jgi:hypothetical protein
MVQRADGENEKGANLPFKFRTKQEAEYFFRARRFELIDTAIRLVIPWGSLVAIAFWVHRDVVALAGRQTLAHIGLSFMGDIKVSDAVAYIFGAAGAGYGIAERTLRRKNIARLAEENRTLEKIADPLRSSSNLTRRGTTRPEDKK